MSSQNNNQNRLIEFVGGLFTVTVGLVLILYSEIRETWRLVYGIRHYYNETTHPLAVIGLFILLVGAIIIAFAWHKKGLKNQQEDETITYYSTTWKAV